MLCDRKTTNVAASQPGFIDFVVMPLFQIISTFVPKIAESDAGCIYNLKTNRERWLVYEETEKDKEVYAEVNPESITKQNLDYSVGAGMGSGALSSSSAIISRRRNLNGRPF